jgi:hypothetical protein
MTAALILLVSAVFGEGGGWITRGMALGTLIASLPGSALTRPRRRTPSHRTGKNPVHR